MVRSGPLLLEMIELERHHLSYERGDGYQNQCHNIMLELCGVAISKEIRRASSSNSTSVDGSKEEVSEISLN
jgi:hypothetical protein